MFELQCDCSVVTLNWSMWPSWCSMFNHQCVEVILSCPFDLCACHGIVAKGLWNAVDICAVWSCTLKTLASIYLKRKISKSRKHEWGSSHWRVWGGTWELSLSRCDSIHQLSHTEKAIDHHLQAFPPLFSFQNIFNQSLRKLCIFQCVLSLPSFSRCLMREMHYTLTN